METLKTTLSVIYESTDISTEISEDLLACIYTDCVEDESDEISITLKDPDGKWGGSWFPDRGAKLQATFNTESRGSLQTNLMIVDSLRVSGSPRVFEMRAVSIPLDNTIRRTIKTRNFENLNLQSIASQISGEAGLELFWDSQINPTYDRIDQRQESDLAFLKRLGDESGVSVKVAFNKLIIFDQASYETKAPIKTITINHSPVLSWSFEAQQSERYKAVTVKWRDIKQKTKGGGASSQAIVLAEISSSGADIYGTNYENKDGTAKKGAAKTKTEYVEATFTDDTVEEGGQTYVLKKRCTSYAEAERLAKAKLRQLNAHQITGSLSLVGDPELSAGSVVALSGFGYMDGNFIIERASHSMTSAGYVTQVDLRKINPAY